MNIKTKLITLLALSATICLSSCKEDTRVVDPLDGDNVVILRLDLPSAPGTRASLEAPITSTVVPGMQKVDIYFYDKNSRVTYSVQTLNATQLATATAVGGLQIPNLHANVNSILIVCNDTEAKGLNTAVNTLIDALYDKTLDINLEQDFSNLTYMGNDEDLVQTSTPEGGSDDINYFNAEIVVVPLVARIEVSGITLIGTPASYESPGYIRLRSVFLEDVIESGIRLSRAINPGASTPVMLPQNESTLTSFTQTWWNEALEAPNTGANADLSSTPWSPIYDNSNPADPTTGVFAYHIFANNGVPTIGLFTNANNVTTTINQYVRFKTYSDASGAVDSFLAGHIYKISPQFGEIDLKEHDEAPTEINLSITVQEWTIHNNIIGSQ